MEPGHQLGPFRFDMVPGGVLLSHGAVNTLALAVESSRWQSQVDSRDRGGGDIRR